MSAELEKGLYSLLSGNSPTTAAGTRIYPILPQGVTFPTILYGRLAANRVQSLDANVGVTEVTMAIESGAESYSAVKSLADQVRTILHGYSGAWGTLTCQNCVLDNETDSYEQEGDRTTHWVTQIYRIWTNMD